MCSGGRIVNYLKAMLGDPLPDVLFCGYQAAGTPHLDGPRTDIRAGIHTLGGFSAHADQKDLLNFVRRIPKPPQRVRIVHGDDAAKATLASCIRALDRRIEVTVP